MWYVLSIILFLLPNTIFHILSIHGYATFHLFIHWLIHWLFLCFLATMNNAAMNICVQVFVWKYVFIFLGLIPGNEIAEDSHFNF